MNRSISARMAITIATGHGWRPGSLGEMLELLTQVQYGSKGSNIEAILHGMDCGRVLSALDTVGHPSRDWALLAYAAPGWADDDCPFRVHSRLMLAYVLQQTRQPKAPEKIGRLAWVTLHDMRVRYLRHEDAMPPALIAAKVGFDVRAWSKWREKKAVMEEVIEDWDREAVQCVAEVLRQEAA